MKIEAIKIFFPDEDLRAAVTGSQNKKHVSNKRIVKNLLKLERGVR